MNSEVLYLFKNTRAVILAQKAIHKLNIKCLIIPVPRSISSECGMCIETKKAKEVEIDSVLFSLNIFFNKCYEYKK